jgi:hypothetical protein
MLAAEKVNRFISSKHPEAVCDRCICGAIGFQSHAHSAQITAALGTTSDFIRGDGRCSLCGEERIVIRATLGSTDAPPPTP